MLSANTAGSVTGNISAFRAVLAPMQTEADYLKLLEEYVPHMPVSLRKLIAAAVLVRPLGIQMLCLPMQVHRHAAVRLAGALSAQLG